MESLSVVGVLDLEFVGRRRTAWLFERNMRAGQLALIERKVWEGVNDTRLALQKGCFLKIAHRVRVETLSILLVEFLPEFCLLLEDPHPELVPRTRYTHRRRCLYNR